MLYVGLDVRESYLYAVAVDEAGRKRVLPVPNTSCTLALLNTPPQYP